MSEVEITGRPARPRDLLPGTRIEAMTRGTVQSKWRRTVNACGELARPTDLDIHRGRRTTNQTRDRRRILTRGCPREAGSYGARQSEGDENGIIVPVKWCGLVSLSIKAW